MGVKKGNLSKALEEAIDLWIAHVSERRRKKEEGRRDGKTKIGWT
jgi:hypothetical protein